MLGVGWRMGGEDVQACRAHSPSRSTMSKARARSADMTGLEGLDARVRVDR